tara:strand:+ start:5419 stop:5661 length:243 start_codon:yes stop_codon:yes gene_type:complete
MSVDELKSMILKSLKEWNHRPTYVLTNMVNSDLHRQGKSGFVKTPRILYCLKALEKEGRVEHSPKKYNPYAKQLVWCLPS